MFLAFTLFRWWVFNHCSSVDGFFGVIGVSVLFIVFAGCEFVFSVLLYCSLLFFLYLPLYKLTPDLVGDICISGIVVMEFCVGVAREWRESVNKKTVEIDADGQYMWQGGARTAVAKRGWLSFTLVQQNITRWRGSCLVTTVHINVRV